MKVSYYAILGLISLMSVLVDAQIGTCGGDCIFSEDCALEAGDFDCRCSYFNCKKIDPGTCGGGCITDDQCSKWAGGDSSCACGPMFECMRKADMDKPGFDTFVRFMKSAHGAKYQKKVNEMLRLSKQKEEASKPTIN